LKKTNKCIESDKESTHKQHNRKEQALSPIPKLPDPKENSKMQSVQKKKCKMPLIIHKCAYSENEERTLESISDAICYLSGMFKISYATSFWFLIAD